MALNSPAATESMTQSPVLSIDQQNVLKTESGEVQGRPLTSSALFSNFDLFRELVSSVNGRSLLLPTLRTALGSNVASNLQQPGSVHPVGTDLSSFLKGLKVNPFNELSPSPADFGHCQTNESPGSLKIGYIAKAAGILSATIDGKGFSIDHLYSANGATTISINPTGGVTFGPPSQSSAPAGGHVSTKAGCECGAVVSFSGVGLSDGQYQGTLHISTADGAVSVPLHCEVRTIGDLSITGLTPLKVAQGGSVSVNLSVTAMKTDAKVTVSPNTIPAGLTLQAPTIQVPAGTTKLLTLTFKAAADANVGKNQLVKLAFSGAQNSPSPIVKPLQIDIYDVLYEWSWHTDKTKVTCDTSLIVNMTGAWAWTGHLLDTSTWYGDQWLLEAGLPYKDPNTGKLKFHYVFQNGSLGAAESGGARNAYINQSGTSANLKNNFFFAVDHGARFYLNVQGDPIPAIEEALKTAISLAKEYGPEIAEAAAML